jgi:hypothetical protein
MTLGGDFLLQAGFSIFSLEALILFLQLAQETLHFLAIHKNVLAIEHPRRGSRWVYWA